MALLSLQPPLSFPPTSLCPLSSIPKLRRLRLPSAAHQISQARLRPAPCFSAKNLSRKSSIEILEDELRELDAVVDLCVKHTEELSNIQTLLAEKDLKLRMTQETLSQMKEVHIYYWIAGRSVEVAGSFDGWQNRWKMDLNPYVTSYWWTSKPSHWRKTLYLYPGVYEIKFIVDGKWQIDSNLETIVSNGITNNVLRVYDDGI